MNINECFKDFLIGYVSAGHTTTSKAMKELNELTEKFVNNLPEHYCFKIDFVKLYCEHMLEIMSEENKGFFHFYFEKRRYYDMIVEFLFDIIKEKEIKYGEYYETNSDGLVD